MTLFLLQIMVYVMYWADKEIFSMSYMLTIFVNMKVVKLKKIRQIIKLNIRNDLLILWHEK